jgi:hypothetical protein
MLKVAVPVESSVAVPNEVVPSKKVIVPVGVPLTPMAVAVNTICDSALDGLTLDCSKTVVPFLTTWEMAGETVGELLLSPG